MRFHSHDEIRREGSARRKRWPLLNRSWYLHDVPLPTPACRVRGHDPIVDGTPPRPTSGDPGYRWVVCARCGLRPYPQGSLDPTVFAVGERYRGPFFRTPDPGTTRWDDIKERKLTFYPPGPFAGYASTTLSGQVIVGPNARPHSVGFQLKVGNPGSENALAGHIHLGWIGSFYWSSGNFGWRIARKLNGSRERYESRVTGLDIELRQFAWEVWAPRHSWSSTDPKWMRGSVNLSPADHLLGRRTYSSADVEGGTIHRVLRLPEGGDRLVELRLREEVSARRRWPYLRRRSYSVWWQLEGQPVPLRGPNDHHKGIRGASVDVTDTEVARGTWPSAAVAAITTQIVRLRTGYGYEPLPLVHASNLAVS